MIHTSHLWLALLSRSFQSQTLTEKDPQITRWAGDSIEWLREPTEELGGIERENNDVYTGLREDPDL